MIRNNKYQIKSNEMQAKKQHRNLIKEVLFLRKMIDNFAIKLTKRRKKRPKLVKLEMKKEKLLELLMKYKELLGSTFKTYIRITLEYLKGINSWILMTKKMNKVQQLKST